MASAVKKLHHFAWRCKDAEATRAFYEDLLGMRLMHVIRADNVPSTGEYCPYVHIFFEMADGAFIAFFDLGDDTPSAPSPNTPEWINHLALEVESADALEAFKQRIEDNGAKVHGVVDRPFVQSIYFTDPNDLRVELTIRTSTAERMTAQSRSAHDMLNAWTAEKRLQRARSA